MNTVAETCMWYNEAEGTIKEVLSDVVWHYEFLYGTVKDNYCLFQSIIFLLTDLFPFVTVLRRKLGW